MQRSRIVVRRWIIAGVFVVGIGSVSAVASDLRAPDDSQEVARQKGIPLKIDYAPPPTTWREAFDRTDLVAVIRLKGKEPAVVGDNDSPRTRFQVEVVDVIGGPHAKSIGREIAVTREGGIATVRGVSRLIEEGGFPTWSEGETFVVFLKWFAPYDSYTLPFGPDAAFQQDSISKKVKTTGVGRLAAYQKGRTFADLVTELKASR